ncbi:MAG: hypothetical protein EAZ97_15475 [Bacteroidetes bacterium]|nr:MAG: hypothetical protein EAZ97_15475 [Bacteroidota bacterium]
MRHDKPIFSSKDFKKDVFRNVLSSVENLDKKVKIIQNWQKSIISKKINTAKEEELQADFLYQFFGEILGYPYQQHLESTQLRLEVKTLKDQSKADGALGYFEFDQEKQSLKGDIRAVIELKDAQVNLDKKQYRKDFAGTPVEQAFNYASKFEGKTEWIIVSDFLEIRLYHISNSDKYELFNILELLEEQNLKRFFALLQKDRLFLKDQDSPTKILFTEKQAEEVKITNEFYRGYRDHREDLFFNLLRQNLKENPLELLSASQKVLDRLIFICFVRDAIPMINALAEARKYAQLRLRKKDTKLWEALQDIFISFDEGYMPNIPSFNGGLFKTDHLLDKKLQIKDDFLYPLVDFILLYDFESQLNVSILGHIFEQSIADLEILRAEIAELGEIKEDQSEAQILGVHNKISKRKKDGIFYTPDYVTKYMLQGSIGGWLEEKKQELLQIHATENVYFWQDYENILRNISIIDPACGSGAFLTAVFEFLWAEWKMLINSTIKLGARAQMYQKEEWQLKKTIVLNNIFGVDLNMESAEITKLALWLQTASVHEPLSDLSNNIKRGNSLIDDPEITEWAFDWKKQFPNIKNGFDIVIGNPPYVNIELIPKKARIFLLENYKTCKGRTDLYVAFIEQAQKLVAKNGSISFIIPHSFTSQNYGEIARKQLIENTSIREITDLSSFFVFEDANVKNIILRFRNNLSQKLTEIRKFNSEQEVRDVQFTSFQVPQSSFLKLKANRFETKNIYHLLDLRDKICQNAVTFGKICFVAMGIRVHDDKKGITKKYFIKEKYTTGLKPYLEGRNINRYNFSGSSWLDYKPEKHNNSMFPELFENEKIMFLRIVKDRLRFAYDNKGFYNSHTVVNCVRYDKLADVNYVSVKSALREIDVDFAKNYDYAFLLALLNSRLMTWFFNNFLSDSLNFYPNDAKSLPIICLSAEMQKAVIEKAILMQNLKNDYYEFEGNVLDVFKSDFHHKKVSKKLNLWYQMTFEEFIAEIIKCGGKVSSSLKFDYVSLFKKQKEKAINLVNLLEKTDQQIDALVYKLYNLSSEEINLIENGSRKL